MSPELIAPVFGLQVAHDTLRDALAALAGRNAA